MATLSDLARSDVWTQCVLCTHYTRWMVVDLIARAGSQTSLERVLSRLRCKHCGTYSAAFRFRHPVDDLRLLERYKKSK